jgi:hypothetical protein
MDRLVEFVSPTTAARRYHARAAIEVARAMPLSSYRGAVATRTGTPFDTNMVSYRGGRTADRRDFGRMRDRARRVYDENPIGQALLDTETDNVISEGYSLQMKSGNPDFNIEATERFYQFLETADVAGQRTASDWFRDSWLEPRKDGDGGILLVDRGGYPKLQYIPGDLIRNPYGGIANAQNGNPIYDGVECDASARPVGFYVRDIDEQGKDTTTRFDARDFVWISHRANKMGPRGATCYRSIFGYLDQLDAYVDSAVVAARMACIFGLIIKKRNPGATISALDTLSNSQGVQQKAVTLENGMINVMGTDEDMVQVQAQQPVNGAPDFIRAVFRLACLPFGMPLEIGMRDLSQVNFSGGRIGLLSYYRGCRVKQDWLKSKCWNRIIFWWLSKERKRQNAGFSDAFVTPFPADYGKFELHGREWDFTDPVTEAQADLLEISMGIKSPQQASEARGRDWDDTQVQIEAARASNGKRKIPSILSNFTRDESQKVTAVDANGNPVGGGPSAGSQEFKQKVVAAFLADKTVNDIIYNVTDVPQLLEDVGLPIDRKVQTNPDQALPLLPVVADNGQLVSGGAIYDPQGDLVGGDVENNMDGPATVDANKSASEPAGTKDGLANGDGGQNNQNDPPKDMPNP